MHRSQTNKSNPTLPMEFTVLTALESARSGQLEDWVQAYLTGGHWANRGLADGLRLQQRWWLGPVLIPISELIPACGPESWMEYNVPVEQWEKKVNSLAEGMTDLLAVPPLIAEYRSGSFSIRDGNHRHEAIRRKGWFKCWVLIWHNSEKEWLLNPYKVKPAG